MGRKRPFQGRLCEGTQRNHQCALVPKLQLGNVLGSEALLRRRGCPRADLSNRAAREKRFPANFFPIPPLTLLSNLFRISIFGFRISAPALCASAPLRLTHFRPSARFAPTAAGTAFSSPDTSAPSLAAAPAHRSPSTPAQTGSAQIPPHPPCSQTPPAAPPPPPAWAARPSAP